MDNSKNLLHLSKVFRETYNTARVISSNHESWASCFAKLLNNNELTEQHKEVIKEWSINFFEVRKERDKNTKELHYSIEEEYRKVIMNEEYYNELLKIYNLNNYSIPNTHSRAYHSSRLLDEILKDLIVDKRKKEEVKLDNE
ncbi:14495_t:CDS:2, partial [Gigaspora margarita]